MSPQKGSEFILTCCQFECFLICFLLRSLGPFAFISTLLVERGIPFFFLLVSGLSVHDDSSSFLFKTDPPPCERTSKSDDLD